MAVAPRAEVRSDEIPDCRSMFVRRLLIRPGSAEARIDSDSRIFRRAKALLIPLFAPPVATENSKFS
jgi:hypothetical protein